LDEANHLSNVTTTKTAKQSIDQDVNASTHYTVASITCHCARELAKHLPFQILIPAGPQICSRTGPALAPALQLGCASLVGTAAGRGAWWPSQSPCRRRRGRRLAGAAAGPPDGLNCPSPSHCQWHG